MRPDHDRGRPGEKATSNVTNVDKISVQLTGCACGHLEDYDCVRHESIPAMKGCGGCQSLSHEEIQAASHAGYFCTPTRCALRSLREAS